MPDNQGRLSPFTSSSGQQVEEPDNSIEYYVKASKEESGYLEPSENIYAGANQICGNCKFYIADEEACQVVSGGVARDAWCKLYIEGGEKEMDKGLDVNESITTDRAYNADTNTTEPDPKSELAMQKFNELWKTIDRAIGEAFMKAAVVGGPTYTKPAEQEGVGTYSTTANSTVQAPPAGATTEPSSVHKADENMQLCNCMGMNKCIGCACAGCQTCDGCSDDVCQGCACQHEVQKNDSCCGNCGPDCEGDCCDDCEMVAKLLKMDGEEDEDAEEIEKKEFPSARRKQLAREGKAMGDGSYPIESVQDLKNAIRSWGRGGAKPDVKAHIIRRAKALGQDKLIPENWKKSIQKSVWNNAFLPLD